MRSTTRRVWAYWLLLLLPALGVGLVAIQLLRRERQRIAEQSEAAWESRRVATEARARLIVENAELLVGDVQNGLLDALEAQPEEQLEALARDWETHNPLVKTVFVAQADGELLRPSGDGVSEEQRGFTRRFGQLLREQTPWRTTELAAATARKKQAAAPERRAIESNVAQVQSARRDVQELLKSRSYDAASAPPVAAPSTDAELSEAGARDARRAELERSQRARVASAGAAEKKRLETQARETPRRGWLAETMNGRLHVLGWVRASDGAALRGVEIDMAALVSRIGSALPAETAAGEGFALRDENHRTSHQVGRVPRNEQAIATVPLATSLLPGWSVAAFLPAPTYGEDSSRGFFVIGSMLVATCIAAILAGGSLLLRQARRSEEEAAQKTSFVANVSHEFKTPLTTIRLYSELLEQGRVRDASQGNEYLRTIGRETERLARLVNNALDFSRLEQGQKKFARQTVDVVAELNRVLCGQAPRLAEIGLNLVRDFSCEPLTAITDRDAMEQIVLNLIDNAVKYAASGGEIAVAARAPSGGGVEVRVSDRGSGVPTAHRERIFEKFHRVDETLTAEKSGAGLGLSIARQLARGLGGDLRYADRPGGGAEFILELP